MAVAWTLLAVAGVAEIAFAVSLDAADGFSRLGPSVAAVGLGSIAVFLLSRALQVIPLSTGYAAFTAIGALGTVVVGLVARHETVTAARLGALTLVLIGVVALRATTP